jgi:proprotein convertase subtilisin/kexin type 5
LSCSGRYLNTPEPPNSYLLSCIPPATGNTVNRRCFVCHSSCSTCTGTLPSQCLTCSGSLFQYLGSCVSYCPSVIFKHPTQNICQVTCPQGFYGNTTTWTCDACHSTCWNCTGPLPTQCTACSGSLFMKFGGSECLATCLPNSYARVSTPNDN